MATSANCSSDNQEARTAVLTSPSWGCAVKIKPRSVGAFSLAEARDVGNRRRVAHEEEMPPSSLASSTANAISASSRVMCHQNGIGRTRQQPRGPELEIVASIHSGSEAVRVPEKLLPDELPASRSAT